MARVPIVGDALMVAGGIFKTKLIVFAILAGIGKSLRYAVVLWGAQLFRTGMG